MIAIIDGGSTKADWRIIEEDGKQSQFSTSGFNPFILSEDEIYQSLDYQLDSSVQTNQFKEIYFYGAGCSDEFRCNIVKKAMQRVFPNATIVVDHDTIACAKACCGNEAGIACIIGTGSNTCLYDGKKIIDHVTNLGYLVGDEGSGGHLGKELLRAYFYRELPADILEAFETQFPIGEREILNQLYNKDKPNVYLASFSRFLSDHKTHPFVRGLVKGAFDEFIKRHIVKYEGHTTLPINFVGSVAFHYKDILNDCLTEKNMHLGIVLKKPIDNLVNYHLQGESFKPVEPA